MPEPSAIERREAGESSPDARPFTDILCAIDGTRRSYVAVEQAAELAGPRGSLTLLAVTSVAGAGAYRTAAISPPRAERILRHSARLASERGVAVSTVIEPSGPVAEAILERVGAHELLAMGAPTASWLGERLVARVGLSALASLTRPLLAARAPAPGHAAFAERILVASDGLEDSDGVVELGARLARTHASSIALLHAVGVESRSRPHRIARQAGALEDALGAKPELRIEAAEPAAAILAAAAELDSSLIVMGSRRREGLAAIGGVSRRVLHDAGASVLLVAPAQV